MVYTNAIVWEYPGVDTFFGSVVHSLVASDVEIDAQQDGGCFCVALLLVNNNFRCAALGASRIPPFFSFRSKIHFSCRFALPMYEYYSFFLSARSSFPQFSLLAIMRLLNYILLRGLGYANISSCTFSEICRNGFKMSIFMVST